MTLTTWGIDGLTFEETVNGKVFLQSIITPKNANGTIAIDKEYGFGLLFNLTENVEFEDYKKPPEIVTFLDNSLYAQDTVEMSPQLQLDSQSLEAIRIISEKLTPYVLKTSTDFITGVFDIEKEWDSYLLELENMGYLTLEEVWNYSWEEQNTND
jgi:hypothetical protein